MTKIESRVEISVSYAPDLMLLDIIEMFLEVALFMLKNQIRNFRFSHPNRPFTYLLPLSILCNIHHYWYCLTFFCTNIHFNIQQINLWFEVFSLWKPTKPNPKSYMLVLRAGYVLTNWPLGITRFYRTL